MSRKVAILEAPMAVTSNGSILVNANQLGMGNDLDALVAYAEATGLPIFVGVAVHARHRRRLVREIDDAVADVVGRLGSRIARPKRT